MVLRPILHFWGYEQSFKAKFSVFESSASNIFKIAFNESISFDN